MAKPDKHAERYHREFAGRLIEMVEKHTAPWQQPWKVGERIGPRNLATEQPYRGGNTIRLMAEAQDRGYSDSRWGTYEQIQAAGGQVRKGERGTQILSFKTHRRVPVKDEKGSPVKDDKGKPVYRQEKLARPFTRIYTVFNAEQARGIKPEPRPAPTQAWQAHKRAEAVIRASGVPVEHVHGDRAYYELPKDRVVLPEKNQFASADNYYQTALHELGHATGHPDRMDRDTLKDGMDQGFGSEPYAREELRAEISAMMTGDRLGTGHDPSRGAAYVKSWVEVLDKNPREIVAASAEAQRMSDYLISRAQERTQEQGEKTQGPDPKRSGDTPEYRPVEVPHRPEGDPNVRDQNGMTPLHRAASAGNAFNVRRYIQAGADVNARDVSGRTPLHWAADSLSGPEAVNQLLKAGADPNMRDHDGWTPLQQAVASDSEESVKHLLEAKASPAVADSAGRTPLHYAAANCSPENTEQLLKAGADPNVRDHAGRTPLDMATARRDRLDPSHRNDEAVRLFEKAATPQKDNTPAKTQQPEPSGKERGGRRQRAKKPIRQAATVIVEEPSQLRPGGTAARVTPLRNRGEGFVRGAGRPGVRKDQPPQPDRGGLER